MLGIFLIDKAPQAWAPQAPQWPPKSRLEGRRGIGRSTIFDQTFIYPTFQYRGKPGGKLLKTVAFHGTNQMRSSGQDYNPFSAGLLRGSLPRLHPIRSPGFPCSGADADAATQCTCIRHSIINIIQIPSMAASSTTASIALFD
jgi:hypothetical protein